MVTKICVRNYFGDIYHYAKFYPNRFRGFGSAHAWFRALWHKVNRLIFGGSWERLPPRRVHRFWRKMGLRQTKRFRARKCLLGVAKLISKVCTPIFPKAAIFGPHFDRDLEFFWLNGDVLLSNSAFFIFAVLVVWFSHSRPYKMF